MNEFTFKNVHEILLVLDDIIKEALVKVSLYKEVKPVIWVSSYNKNKTNLQINASNECGNNAQTIPTEKLPILEDNKLCNLEEKVYYNVNEINLGPFNFEWVFGFNDKVPILYLRNECIAFAAAHVPVIYNIQQHRMTPLIGHNNWITCIAASDRFLATCDSGPNASVAVLWNYEKAVPVKCWPSSSPEGMQVLAFDCEAQYLVSISSAFEPLVERWSLCDDTQIKYYLPIQTKKPKHLAAHTTDSNQFVVTFSNTIFILLFSKESKQNFEEGSKPQISKKLGAFTLSLFGDGNIFTGTNLGQIIIWTITAQYVKTVTLNNSKVINLTLFNFKILCAHENGEIGVYTMDLQLQHWINRKEFCANLSFSPATYQTLPNYIIANPESGLTLVTRRGTESKLLYPAPAAITCLDNRPNSNIFASGNARGNICICDTAPTRMIINKNVFKGSVSAIKFSPDGWLLAAASEWGDFLILEPILLQTIATLPLEKASINKICFDTNGKALAFYYCGMTVGLVKQNVSWVFRGKHSSHRMPITDITTGPSRLFTIGEDRMLAEYDIKHNLRFICQFKIEISAKPVLCRYYDNILLVANTENKIRFVDTKSQVIIRTVQGPSLGPIRELALANGIFLYAAGKNIGICDPTTFQCGPQIQSFPSNVTNLSVIGKRVITSSKTDNSVFSWTLNEPLPATEQPTFPAYIDTKIREMFELGPILIDELIYKMQFLGFFPSAFETDNILREVTTTDVTEEEFRIIFWNYKPLYAPTISQVYEALLCVSNVRDTMASVSIEKLVTAIETGLEPVQREEILKCLYTLYGSESIPTHLPIHDFLQIILGIDPSIIEN